MIRYSLKALKAHPLNATIYGSRHPTPDDRSYWGIVVGRQLAGGRLMPYDTCCIVSTE